MVRQIPPIQAALLVLYLSALWVKAYVNKSTSLVWLLCLLAHRGCAWWSVNTTLELACKLQTYISYKLQKPCGRDGDWSGRVFPCLLEKSSCTTASLSYKMKCWLSFTIACTSTNDSELSMLHSSDANEIDWHITLCLIVLSTLLFTVVLVKVANFVKLCCRYCVK